VRFEVADTFRNDWKRIDRNARDLFSKLTKEQFSPACDVWVEDPSTKWPGSLRVKPLKGHAGLWEMTWSFSSPDGRATFQFVKREGILVVRWRRIGDHGIYDRP
jgi:hypothetical protein